MGEEAPENLEKSRKNRQDFSVTECGRDHSPKESLGSSLPPRPWLGCLHPEMMGWWIDHRVEALQGHLVGLYGGAVLPRQGHLWRAWKVGACVVDVQPRPLGSMGHWAVWRDPDPTNLRSLKRCFPLRLNQPS